MKKLYKVISSKILEYDELDQLDKQLLEIARLARERAVAPYSKYKVVALCPNGQVAITAIDSAFPIRFGPDDLGIDHSKK